MKTGEFQRRFLETTTGLLARNVITLERARICARIAEGYGQQYPHEIPAEAVLGLASQYPELRSALVDRPSEIEQLQSIRRSLRERN